MKKVLLLCIAVVVAVSSCSKSEKNPYIGTKWTRVLSETMTVLEFTSDTEAMVYKADVNGNFISITVKGNYTFNDNLITFSNMVDKGAVDYFYERAEVSGNTLQLFYYWVNDGEKKYYSPILKKE